MHALVTGGAKGLGAALAIALAKQGYSIAVHYRNSEKEALKVVAECRKLGVEAEVIQGDFHSVMSTAEFIERYQNRFPDTSLLVNNVGEYLTSTTLETTVEEWSHLFQVNLHAPFILSQRLIPTLKEYQGQIINVGVCGLMRRKAHNYATAYRLAKEGLLGLTLALAKELTPSRVRVNMVSPGHLEGSIDLPDDQSLLPMERPATYEEICRVVTFLIDPANGYLTGQNIEIAGGLGLS